MRFRVAEAEKCFREMFNSQAEQTNLPDEVDPNAPRILFQDNHKSLFLTQVACQLNLAFNRDLEKPIEEQFEIIAKNIAETHARLVRFKSLVELAESAIVLTINAPANSTKQEMHDYVYNRFFKTTPLGDIASVGFKIGYKTDDGLFMNVETNVYELRIANFAGPISGHATINVNEVPVSEEGFVVKLDVNNKPSVSVPNYVSTGPSVIVDRARQFLHVELGELMGFDVA